MVQTFSLAGEVLIESLDTNYLCAWGQVQRRLLGCCETPAEVEER